MTEGIIIKALSGFYTVRTPEGDITCKARGKFRLDGTSPLVGDKVSCALEKNRSGRIEQVLPRRNWFVRPAVANIDALVFVAANVNPVTDPFLIDRVSVIAAEADCELILCVNKTDLDQGIRLREDFSKAGFSVFATSAETGEGVDRLREALRGKVCAFTGNSGVGKSSLLNRLIPGADLPTAQVSEKLGRGKHTTRHVELFRLGEDSYIADTPGFASFEIEMMKPIAKENLQYDFQDFQDYIGKCRFPDCSHRKEPGCAVREAAQNGQLVQTRYRSYLRLYEQSAQFKDWELREKNT